MPTAHARGSQCGRICNANYCLFDGCPMHPTAHVHNLAGHYTRSCIYFHYHTDLHANAVCCHVQSAGACVPKFRWFYMEYRDALFRKCSSQHVLGERTLISRTPSTGCPCMASVASFACRHRTSVREWKSNFCQSALNVLRFSTGFQT